MKASYAHELAIMAKSKAEPLPLFQDIEAAARAGNLFMILDHALTPAEVAELKGEGYSVHIHTYLQGSAETYISW